MCVPPDAALASEFECLLADSDKDENDIQADRWVNVGDGLNFLRHELLASPRL